LKVVSGDEEDFGPDDDVVDDDEAVGAITFDAEGNEIVAALEDVVEVDEAPPAKVVPPKRKGGKK
jgi:hypothetical protein